MKNVLCFGEVLWDAFGEEKTAGGAPMVGRSDEKTPPHGGGPARHLAPALA